MEKRETHKKGILHAAFCTFYALFARIFLPAAVAQPSLMVYVLKRHGALYTSLAGVLSALLLFLLWGWQSSALFVCLMLPGGVALYETLARKRPAFESLIITTGAFLVGVLAMHYLVIAVYGKDFIALEMDRLVQSVQQALPNTPQARKIEAYYLSFGAGSPDALMRFLTTGSSGISFDELVNQALQLLKVLESSLRLIMPCVFFIFAMLMGLVNQSLSRTLLKRAGTELAGYPSLRAMRLPKGFGWGMLVICACALLLEAFNVQGFTQVTVTLAAVVGFVFGVQGLALIDWFLHSRGARTAARTIFEVLIIFFWLLLCLNNLYWLMALPLIGILEQVLNFRKPKEVE